MLGIRRGRSITGDRHAILPPLIAQWAVAGRDDQEVRRASNRNAGCRWELGRNRREWKGNELHAIEVLAARIFRLGGAESEFSIRIDHRAKSAPRRVTAGDGIRFGLGWREWSDNGAVAAKNFALRSSGNTRARKVDPLLSGISDIGRIQRELAALIRTVGGTVEIHVILCIYRQATEGLEASVSTPIDTPSLVHQRAGAKDWIGTACAPVWLRSRQI